MSPMPLRCVLAALLLSLLALTCGAPAPVNPLQPSVAPPDPKPLPTFARDATWGVQLAPVPGQEQYVPRIASVQALDPKDISALLAQVSFGAGNDESARPRSKRSLSPVIGNKRESGSTSVQNIPSLAAPSAVALAPDAPLGVSSSPTLSAFGPVGSDNPAHSFVSLAFDHAVVAREEVGLGASKVPFRLVPEVPGTWRWLTTSLLTFEPHQDLPMATRFTVRYAGDEPARHPTWLGEHTFETAALDVVEWFPPDGASEVSPTPSVFVRFNQRVRAEAILPFITFVSQGKSVGARLTTPEEDRSDAARRAQFEKVGGIVYPDTSERRATWLRIKPREPLPAREVSVRLAPGAASAEGPKALSTSRRVTFRTAERAPCEPERPCSPESTRSKVDNSGPVLGRNFRPETKLRVGIEPIQVLLADRPARLTFETQGATLAKAAVYQVKPNDMPAFWQYSEQERRNRGRLRGERDGDGRDGGEGKAPPGELLEVRPFDSPASAEWTSHRLDLNTYLPKGLGHLVVQITLGDLVETRWVQVTNLGFTRTGRTGSAELYAFDLVSHEPQAGVVFQLLTGGPSSTSDARGVATLPLGRAKGYLVLSAKRDEDQTLENFWAVAPEPPGLQWSLREAQSEFEPGGRVVMAGHVGPSPLSAYYGQGTYSIAYRLQPRFFRLNGQKPYFQGEVPVNSEGKFALEFRLPDVERNDCTLELELRRNGTLVDKTYERDLPIQIPKAQPRVLVVSASEEQSIVGEPVTVTTRVRAFAGAPLAGERVYWRAQAFRSRIAPPGFPGFAFGPEELKVNDASGRRYLTEENEGESVFLDGSTDKHGAHALQLSLGAAGPFPRHVELAASTHPWRDDAGNVVPHPPDVVEAKARVYVAPASVTAGVRPTRDFVLAGEPILVDVIVVDNEGRPQVDLEVVVQAGRRVFDYDESFMPTAECRLRSAATPQRCRLDTKRAGNTRVLATVTDRQGRRSDTETSVFVGGEEMLTANHGLLAVKAHPTAVRGQPVPLLLMTTDVPATGWLQLTEGDSAVRRQNVHLEAPITELSLPALTSSARAELVLVGTRLSQASDRPTEERLPSELAVGIPLPLDSAKEGNTRVLLRQTPAVQVGELALGAEVTRHGKPVAGQSVELSFERGDCRPRIGERQIGVMTRSITGSTPALLGGTLRYVRRPETAEQSAGDSASSEAEREREQELTHHFYPRVDNDDGAIGTRQRHDGATVHAPQPEGPPAQQTDSAGEAHFRFGAPRLTGPYCATARVGSGGEAPVQSAPVPVVVAEQQRPGELLPLVSLQAPSQVSTGDLVHMTANVQNPDAQAVTMRLALAVSGAAEVSELGYQVTLGPGERGDVPFRVQTRGDGDVQATLVAAMVRPATGQSQLADGPEVLVTTTTHASMRVDAGAPSRGSPPSAASSIPAPLEVARHYEYAHERTWAANSADGSISVSHGAPVSVVLAITVREPTQSLHLVDHLPAGLTLLTPPSPKRALTRIAADVRYSAFVTHASASTSKPMVNLAGHIAANEVIASATDLAPGVYLVRYPTRATYRGRFLAVPPDVNGTAPTSVSTGAPTWVVVE